MIILGDCLEIMKSFPDNHFSAIVTDPPYGLSFMNKGWDHVVPEMSYWKEALRISTPGSLLIAMGGTRTFHRLTCAIEDAGWEIRDCISWLYGSGFPKSHNHFGIEGYGTALKPAWEPCIVAMKPLDGTFKNNYEKWGQAGINIDGCRIETEEYISTHSKSMNAAKGKGIFGSYGEQNTNQSLSQKKGRWPANVILDEEAAKMLDEQSGFSKSAKSSDKCSIQTNKNIFVESLGIFSPGRKLSHLSEKGDSGGASRFFYCAKTSPAERNEGLDGLPIGQTIGGGGTNNTSDDVCGKYGSIKAPQKNYHPTVKPLKLMEYLIKLVMPPKDGLLLDPFAGSGTTILAAKRLGFDAIGIEQSQEYCDIARARLENYKPELTLF